MKLRNKKTGEICNWCIDKDVIRTCDGTVICNSLAELTEEWEDYEEPKEDGLDNIITLVKAYSSIDSERYPKEIVEKLRAWKRLKDKGFRFNSWYGSSKDISFSIPQEIIDKTTANDLDLLFGGEE